MSAQCEITLKAAAQAPMSLFERWPARQHCGWRYSPT
jgi:hypothetical protein